MLMRGFRRRRPFFWRFALAPLLAFFLYEMPISTCGKLTKKNDFPTADEGHMEALYYWRRMESVTARQADSFTSRSSCYYSLYIFMAKIALWTADYAKRQYTVYSINPDSTFLSTQHKQYMRAKQRKSCAGLKAKFFCISGKSNFFTASFYA